MDVGNPVGAAVDGAGDFMQFMVRSAATVGPHEPTSRRRACATEMSLPMSSNSTATSAYAPARQSRKVRVYTAVCVAHSTV
jgi:hypothetical protein